MQNPVDLMISRTGMSRTEFALKHGFGKNTLTRLVQGRLQSVTPRVAGALWAEWQDKGLDQDDFDAVYGTLDVDSAFQAWVHNKRISNRTDLPANVKDNPKLTPFGRLVAAIGSVSKTAQTLAVADVVVQRYADGRQKSMPDAIKTALATMGYKHLAELETAQKRWHGTNG